MKTKKLVAGSYSWRWYK